MESLEKLLSWCSRKNIVVVGGGPSLDFCLQELDHLVKEDSVFLLTDIVSANFIKLYPDSNRLIFTVESKRHNYLLGLLNERIACYYRADKKNYNEKLNQCYAFHFDIDENEKNRIKTDNSYAMKSPGTVAGAIIYWGLVAANVNQQKSQMILLGVDLSYIDNQVYNRLCKFTFLQNYWTNRENREWTAVLQRTANMEYVNGYVIRTSREFSLTREKLGVLLSREKFNLYDYSPMGISANFVKKVIPAKISSENNRDIIR
jgi:hypothetical protein